MKVTWPVLLPLLKEKPLVKLFWRRKEGGARKPGFWLLIFSREPHNHAVCLAVGPCPSPAGSQGEEKRGVLSPYRGSAKKTAAPCCQECGQ